MMSSSKHSSLKPPADALWFLSLGGTGVFGANLSLYGHGGKWLMVDCGILFGDARTPGIDVMMPDISFVQEHHQDVLGLVVTHAHEDHLGAIPYLASLLRLPVYATPFAASLLRAKFASIKIQERVDIIEFNPGESFTLGPFTVESIPVTHSVVESVMLAIKTSCGHALHTGDWRLDPQPVIGDVSDEARLAALGREGLLAVVGDSTGALVPGKTPSETSVQQTLKNLFGSYDKRIIVTCFASNIERIHSIAVAAKASGRYVSLVGRSLWRNAQIAADLGYLPAFETFLSEYEAMETPRHKIVMICTGNQGERRAALTRIAVFDHSVVELERGDVVMFSSSEIPGNEKDIARTQSLLLARGIKVLAAKNLPAEKGVLHASGHGAREDMETLYRMVSPPCVMCVHGEILHQAEHAQLARACGVPKTIVPLDGEIWRLGPGLQEKVTEVPVGRLGLDGTALRPLDDAVTHARRRMNFNGAIVATIVLDRHGHVAAAPQLALLGLDDAAYGKVLRMTLTDKLEDELARSPRSVLLDDAQTRQLVLNVIRRHMRTQEGKKPVVDVHLVRL
ncbi:MAG: ribonuclease J [Alphaproteobacteria bacterium]|nr:ribonuclease J [Alphaproteobacteria bacterium]